MIKKYELYLEKMDGLLDKFFQQQKPYIFCKEGCCQCCQNAEYPMSSIEVQYMMLGYQNLDPHIKKIVQSNVVKIKEEKQKSDDKEFMYECPFLIDKKCSVYRYRGIICRAHGLIFYVTDKNGGSRNKLPYCVHLGLNYSNVFDKEQNMVSQELFEKGGFETPPLAYNLSLPALLNNSLTKTLGLEFSELRALIDWF